MDILERFIAEARQRDQTVVLPEGDDARVIAAARRLLDEAHCAPDSARLAWRDRADGGSRPEWICRASR